MREDELRESTLNLLKEYQDLSSVLDNDVCQGAEIMVPVSPVAFMPAIISTQDVTVHLGVGYFVSRKPQQANEIISRRMTDLSHKLNLLEAELKRLTDLPDRKLVDADERPQTVNEEVTSKLSAPPGDVPMDERLTKDTESEGLDGVESQRLGSIMEIREWLDDSGRETATELAEVGKIHQVLSKPTPSKLVRAHKGIRGAVDGLHSRELQEKNIDESGGQKDEHNRGIQTKDMDTVFKELEKQEAEAEAEDNAEHAQGIMLGPQWKKGFLNVKGKGGHQTKSSFAGGEGRRDGKDITQSPGTKEKNSALPGVIERCGGKDDADTGLAHTKDRSVTLSNKGAEFVLSGVKERQGGDNATGASLSHSNIEVPAAPKRVSRFKAQRLKKMNGNDIQ
ncbi:unnamed protein product [Choristocarpus tenellus]